MKTIVTLLMVTFTMPSRAAAQVYEVFRLAPGVTTTYDYIEASQAWSFSNFTNTIDSGVARCIVKDSSRLADTLVAWSIRQERDVIRRIQQFGGFDTSFTYRDTLSFQLNETRSGLHELKGGYGIWEFTRWQTYHVFRYADSAHIKLEWYGGGVCRVIPSNYDTLLFSADSSLSQRSFGECIDFDDFGWITQLRARIRSIVVLSSGNRELHPTEMRLYQNYPNPFNPLTHIKFQIPSTSFVTLKVFDLLGREVATLVNEVMEPGTYEREFNAEGLASSVYVYQLRSGDFVETKKLLLIR